MAFCNSCGATLDRGAKFCAKCGATLPAGKTRRPHRFTCSAAAHGHGSEEQQCSQDHSDRCRRHRRSRYSRRGDRRFFAWNVSLSRTQVQNRDGKVRVETPMGTVNTSNDSDDAVQRSGHGRLSRVHGHSRTPAANVTCGPMHTVTADFETNDPPERSQISTNRSSHRPTSMSATENTTPSFPPTMKNMLTINIEPKDGKTRIHIAKVSGKLVDERRIPTINLRPNAR